MIYKEQPILLTFYRITTEHECTVSCFEDMISRMDMSNKNEDLYQTLTQLCQICGDSDLTWDLGRITTEMFTNNKRNRKLLENAKAIQRGNFDMF